MELGEIIRTARRSAGFTQEQAAEALGVSRQTLSNWERAKTYPDIVSVIRMSELYCVSLDQLLKEGTSMKQTYREFLEESTDSVRSSARKAKIIVVLAMAGIWALSMMSLGIVLAAAGADAAGYGLVVMWMVLPVIFFAGSCIIGRCDYFGRWKWLTAPGISLMYTLSACATAAMAQNMVSVQVIWPAFAKLPVGLMISLIGLAAGAAVRRWCARRTPSEC